MLEERDNANIKPSMEKPSDLPPRESLQMTPQELRRELISDPQPKAECQSTVKLASIPRRALPTTPAIESEAVVGPYSLPNTSAVAPNAVAVQEPESALAIIPEPTQQEPQSDSRPTEQLEQKQQEWQEDVAHPEEATMTAEQKEMEEEITVADDTSTLSASATAKDSPVFSSRIESFVDEPYGFDAPELVTADVDGMCLAYPQYDRLSEKYPAFITQTEYVERLLSIPIGIDNIWLPLKRPAMHNRYHGFCEGAWRIRKSVRSCYDAYWTAS